MTYVLLGPPIMVNSHANIFWRQLSFHERDLLVKSLKYPNYFMLTFSLSSTEVMRLERMYHLINLYIVQRSRERRGLAIAKFTRKE